MTTSAHPSTPDYDKIHQAFEQIKARQRKDLGSRDVQYIKRLRWVSRVCEVLGRGLIWVLPGPFALLGVPFLFIHRNIEAIEIGHNVLHGQYDSFPQIPEFHSRHFRWKAPIDEASWRQEHNGIHHVHTNVQEKDPDLSHGILRTHAQVPHTGWHYFQVPFYLGFVYPFMLYNFNAQNLGMNDQFREKHFPLGNKGYATFENPEKLTETEIKTRDRRSIWRILMKEYGLFPILAGITGFGFLKVLVANLLADILNNYWIALTIQATHLTEPLQPEDALKNKGKWYISQLDSSVNFKGTRLQSILWGHLNYQIEHHLYPDIPSHRYPDIAKEVKQICKEHGLPYKLNESWGAAIRNYLGLLWRYSFNKEENSRTPSFLEQRSALNSGEVENAR